MAIVTPIVAADMRVMTEEVINRRNKPYLALSQLLFPGSRTQLPTEFVQVDEKTGEQVAAKFAKTGSKSTPIARSSGNSYMLKTPNINIHMPLTASTDLAKRMAGETVFVGQEEDIYLRHLTATMVDDIEELNEAVDLAEEWFIAQLLTGTVAYDVDGYDTFSLSTGKPAGNDYSVSPLWTASDPRPLQDLIGAQTVANAYRAPNLNIGICSSGAADAFRELVESGTITIIKTDSGVPAGNPQMIAEYQENGLRYLGTLTGSGIELWEYDATYTDYDGTTNVPYIRDGYIELFSTAPRAVRTRKAYYGAHVDAALIRKRMHLQGRVTFTTEDEDCGTLKQYLKARPFFWFLRADWNVSIKVTA